MLDCATIKFRMNTATLWFLVVGGVAALTHLGVYALIEQDMSLPAALALLHQTPSSTVAVHAIPPEIANAMSFCVAFFISFTGHRYLSFKDTSTSISTSFRRCGLTALAGFATNEAVFIVLLRGLQVPSLVALAVALMGAAAQTFVLGRFWAFRR